jgi:hypothetical protein
MNLLLLEKIMYCGILPYYNAGAKDIYLLLGYEYPRGYSEFGGSAESSDYKQEAIREFHEETHGFFLHLTDELQRLTDNDIIYQDEKSIIYAYELIMCERDIVTIVQAYNNNFSFFKQHCVDNYLPQNSGLFEKLQLDLIHIDLIPRYKLYYYFERNFPIFKNKLLSLVC